VPAYPETGWSSVNPRRRPFTREVAERIVDVILAGLHTTTP
jgi:hypothetical protein